MTEPDRPVILVFESFHSRDYILRCVRDAEVDKDFMAIFGGSSAKSFNLANKFHGYIKMVIVGNMFRRSPTGSQIVTRLREIFPLNPPPKTHDPKSGPFQPIELVLVYGVDDGGEINEALLQNLGVRMYRRDTERDDLVRYIQNLPRRL